MATLICNGTGTLTGASTFAAAETGASALALIRSATINFVAAGTGTSPTFTVTNAKVIDGILLWVFQSAAGSTGTFKVDLQKGGVSQASVTVNKTDLPDGTNLSPVPVFFKFTSTATGDGGANWTVVVTTTGVNAVTYHRNSATANDFTRALRTTTAATAAAGDDLFIVGELTGAGTNTSRTVTMNSTAATAYGNGSVNSTSVNGGGVHVSNYGTLTYGTSASTNYILRAAGDVIVYQFGTLNEGASGAEIPRSSTAVLELQPVSANGDFGLIIRNNGIWNAAGLSRTSGKNVVKCKLAADLTSNNTINASASASNGSLTANAAPNETGSVLALGFTDNVTASVAHYVVFTLVTVTGNTTQTATFWIARGSGTNNRFVRATMGNNPAFASVANGFNVDIDLQAGTVGTPAAIGNGTATSASITAVAGGYVVRLIGKISSATAASCGLFINACSAAGTTSYTGNATQNFVIDHVNVANGTVSDTPITIDTDTGWLNGDAICVAATTRTPGQCEDFLMNADASSSALSTVIYPGGAPSVILGTFTHSGTTPTQAEVGLLTRNVKVRSTSPTLSAYVYCEPLATVNVSWTEFYYLGQLNTPNKRGIETKDGATANAKSFTFCSMHDVITALELNTGSLASLNVTFSNNVVWNTGSVAVTFTGSTASDWTFDSNLVVKAVSHGFNLVDVSGTCTNNTAVGCGTNTGGFCLNSTGGTIIGTFNNNVSHSNTSYGLLIAVGCSGTVNNFTAWRNASSGVIYNSPGITIDLILNNLTLFGNSGTANVNVITTDGVNITGNSVIAGDTSFATNNGITFANTALCEVNIANVDFSGTGSIYAPHATTDLNFNSTLNTVKGTINNCKVGVLSSPLSSVAKSFWTKGAYLAFEKYNQTSGDHRTEMTYGQLKTDTSIYNTASPSMRMTPNNASNKLASAPNGNGILVAVASGGAVNIAVYVRKSASGDGAAYNGNQPRLIQRANPALGQNSDVVLATYSASTGSWNQLSATSSTATDDGAWEFIVDCDGAAGWINVDDWSAS